MSDGDLPLELADEASGAAQRLLGGPGEHHDQQQTDIHAVRAQTARLVASGEPQGRAAEQRGRRRRLVEDAVLDADDRVADAALAAGVRRVGQGQDALDIRLEAWP